ncbi:MAG: tetratricopeptide repeat protein [Saprospiraceae bacterium]|nr:tetratricopeptide repeat protein [Saprospiraceae bacterium]
MRIGITLTALAQRIKSTFPIFLLTLTATGSSWGVNYFEYTPTAVETYDLIFSLRFNEARSKLVTLRLTEPENLISQSLANYMDCLSIFIGEQEETYEKLRQNKELRLAAIRDGDRNSPYYLYTQADIHLQWAITRVKFEDYFQAVMEIKRAFNLLTKNQELFPDFMPNLKNLGLLHALIGTVPDQYRWGLKLLGMSGTIAQGRSEIEEVLAYSEKQSFVFRDEAYVMYAYLLLHLENKGEEAWQMIERSTIDAKTNPLACFVKANVAMQTGRNDQAIEILRAKPEGEKYFPFPYLHFMEGVARLNKLEKGADQYLNRFLRETRGQHYIKEAYQKLAWYEVVHNHPDRYLRYMEACKVHGASVIDEDLTALHEARLNRVPDRHLLTARILFDGGYIDKARHYLETKAPRNYESQEYQLEYYYRLGRIHHRLDHFEEALEYYEMTISNGEFESYYFACNAALMSGTIKEKLGQYEQAKSYFEKTLSIKPDEYRNSLHQKAKAGLNRLEDHY